MKNSFRITALLLALLCVGLLCACSGAKTTDPENESVIMEDGEDVGVEQAEVRVANLTGRDAKELLMRVSGGKWSANILTDSVFSADTSFSVKYNVTDGTVYDLRLVYEDGTYRDFTNLNFGDKNAAFYLGMGDELTTK